ncbi:MAG: hypothetical protein ACKPKO_29670, partial [Candidatus Fonsibacter sp.]
MGLFLLLVPPILTFVPLLTSMAFFSEVWFPGIFSLLHGNHECASVTWISGFYDVCKSRHIFQDWEQFCDKFDIAGPELPLVAGATLPDDVLKFESSLSSLLPFTAVLATAASEVFALIARVQVQV